MKQVILWLALVSTVACGRPDADAAPPTKEKSVVSAQAGTGAVDSAVPIEEALNRFRDGFQEPRALEGGSRSREQLVRRFVKALEVRDTAALRRMGMGIEEFAWFYYPASPLSRKPYELAPGLMWFQLQGESEKGASRLLAERAGRPLRYVEHVCAPGRIEGGNRIHPHCELRHITPAGDTVSERLFGLILERDGLHKFVSYANKL
jgi:hypothetical protein